MVAEEASLIEWEICKLVVAVAEAEVVAGVAEEEAEDVEDEEDDIDDRARKQFVASATKNQQVVHGDDDHCDVTIQSATLKTQSTPQPQREREFLIRPPDT